MFYNIDYKTKIYKDTLICQHTKVSKIHIIYKIYKISKASVTIHEE